jgi:hypothetical protein
MATSRKKRAVNVPAQKPAETTSSLRTAKKVPSKTAPTRANAFRRARALELFRALGARDPESLATAEASGSPALARWLFLAGMWSTVVQDDAKWPGKWADLSAPVPAAIRRMLDRGVDPQDLTDVVRDAQINALYNVAQLLEDCGHGLEEQQAKTAENVEWRLVEYDGDTGEMKRVIGGLHEDFHDTDPTGRGGAPPQR